MVITLEVDLNGRVYRYCLFDRFSFNNDSCGCCESGVWDKLSEEDLISYLRSKARSDT
jgi:hypothetical protein